MTYVRTTTMLVLLTASAAGLPTPASAQEPSTRQEAIAQAEAEKAGSLTPQVPNKAEAVTAKIEGMLQGNTMKWHPFFDSVYSGGGFTLGAGYAAFVSPYNTLDVRGSYTVSGYKRIEAEFIAPRLFKRRGRFSALGGWREATQVGFYGIGTSNTSLDDRTNYSFGQPYVAADLTVRPSRKYLLFRGAEEYSQWDQGPSKGDGPSIETVYTPADLTGLGATVSYLHSEGTVGFDWRTSPGYTRRGGYYGITAHDYHDTDGVYGFQQVDYEAIQHVPILREAWVLSFRARAETTYLKDGQDIPFFMLPSAGGGSSLRAFKSWRFRDRNSLIMQAEWRIMVNRFLETAVFYEAGKVTPSTKDFDFNGLKSDVGFGVRFHGPFATPLRIELAHGNEGLNLVFASSAAF